MGEGLSLLFKFINFAVLVAILLKYGGKPFKDYLRKRHEAVKERVGESERLLSEAAAAKKTYEDKLAALDAEIAAFRSSIVAEMEKERKKIVEEAQAMAKRIREQADLAYGQELKEALAKVRAEIADRTIKAAEQRVRDTFKKEDHEKMVEEFIQKVRSIN